VGQSPTVLTLKGVGVLNVLVAEIGSTTTVVNGFDVLGKRFLGSGVAATSVGEGDVRIGLRAAAEDLKRKLGLSEFEYSEMYATSSAAGGLRMTVHGLVYDMTVRAGREAALGAGANIHMMTAGVLREIDLAKIEGIAPNLILLAGGTDYGERDTALVNAEKLAALRVNSPVIYCGNVQNVEEIAKIFERAGRKFYITENVYPKLDVLNVEPVRELIYRAFEEHITEAPGMEHIREMVTGAIMPTPGAVMECARLLYDEMGDVLVLDVGGATTDVHSVTEGSEEISNIQISPEPLAKRTVEGDLGVYVNAKNMCNMLGLEFLAKETGFAAEKISEILENYKAIPETDEQFRLTEALAYQAASLAIKRHAGALRHTYTAAGRRTWAEGKDLSVVKYLAATGGALTRLPGRGEIVRKLTELNVSGNMLYPQPGNLRLLEDSGYIMASLGVLGGQHAELTKSLVKKGLFES